MGADVLLHLIDGVIGGGLFGMKGLYNERKIMFDQLHDIRKMTKIIDFDRGVLQVFIGLRG